MVMDELFKRFGYWPVAAVVFFAALGALWLFNVIGVLVLHAFSGGCV